jgi:hypothetical protein
MGEELKEWTMMWGAKVKLPNDMPDDMLKDSIETSRRLIDNVTDFESQGLLMLESYSYRCENYVFYPLFPSIVNM